MSDAQHDAQAEGLRRGFLAAADMMRGERPANDPDGRRVLDTVGYSPPRAAPSGGDRHQAALLRAAADCVRIFRLPAPQAPGLFAFGAEVDPHLVAPWSESRPAGVAGVGVSVRQAFEACVGEGVEYLAQFETGPPPCARLSVAEAAPPAAVAALLGDLLDRRCLPPGTALDWVDGVRLRDDAAVRLPADLCYRRPPVRRVIEPAWPLSIGCAAGPAIDAARLHALLELVERDAAALWWRGGRRGRLPGLDDPATEAAAVMLRRFRQGLTARRSWLLDITTDLAIPCMAAVSCDAGGRGFCCGTAARLTPAEAAQAAVREMCQMELAQDVVQAKRRESGDGALNEVDQGHLARAGLDAAACTLLHPLPPGPIAGLADGGVRPLRRLVDRLAEHGLEAFALDLTGGNAMIPAARVLCPGLQPAPSRLVGARLQAAIAATGGGDTYTGRIPLM